MAKVHTRTKRKMGIRSTMFKHKSLFTRIVPVSRPKSFATKEAAEAWSKDHATDGLVLHNTGSKYQWRPKPRG